VHGTIHRLSASAIKFPAETPEQIFKHEQIARNHEQRRRDKTQNRSGALIPLLRVRGMERLFILRHGSSELPNDDAGLEYLRLVADHLAQIKPAMIRAWCETRAPWLTAVEIEALIALAGIGRRWKADPLARELGLTDAERTATKNWTIGAVDCNKAQRKGRRKSKRAEACRAARIAAGATPREQSAARTKPWEALGISRASYYRKPGETNSRPVTISTLQASKQSQKHTQRAERAAERSPDRDTSLAAPPERKGQPRTEPALTPAAIERLEREAASRAWLEAWNKAQLSEMLEPLSPIAPSLPAIATKTERGPGLRRSIGAVGPGAAAG
jgi:hypothetical protein